MLRPRHLRFGFGTSTRPPLNMPNDAPAPGTYPIPDGVRPPRRDPGPGGARGVFRGVSGSGVVGAGPKSTAHETVEALVPQVTCMVPNVSQVTTLLSKHYSE